MVTAANCDKREEKRWVEDQLQRLTKEVCPFQVLRTTLVLI